MATTSNGALSGVTDIFGSILGNAAGIINAVKGTTTPANTSANLAYDKYGRQPGQPGYGTDTPPASGVTSTGLSTGKIVALVAGVVVALGIAAKLLFGKRRKN